MSNLFISHSSADNKAAAELQAALKKQQHRSVFLDFDPADGIPPGVSWERTLYTELRSCEAVVALCSDNYFASQWCFAEIALARMEGKQLFVLQIDPWGDDSEFPSILDEEQRIDLRTDPDDGYRRLWRGFELKGIVPSERRSWKPGEPPYPGLRAFEERDAAIFFGRGAEVRDGVELLNRVRRQGHPRMVMVLGSSGSGKSSLARAGLVPQLKRDKESWLVVGPLRPGSRPGRELALALSQAFAEAGDPRPWQELLDRLGLTDEAVGNGEAVAAPSPDEAVAARKKLRAALAEMEVELTAADKQLVRSVDLLKSYLAGSGVDTATAPSAPPVGSEANPLATLATELRLARAASLIEALEAESEETLDEQRQLAEKAREAKVVILIDQFEELLGYEGKGPGHAANRFLALLKDGIEGDDNPPLALGTMRSDFLGLLQRSGPLRGVGFKSLSVGPMSKAGMKQVIKEPARLGGIKLEDDIANTLLDATGTADALPLLAFTLRAMWNRYHEKRRFDAAGYKALGGLDGAIARVADETMKDALEASAEGTEKDLRIAFLDLARPAADGEGWARKPASLVEMPERVKPMIELFIEQRLLVAGKDNTVEVAHEALFRSWDTLKGWLAANFEGLHLLREIADNAKKWKEEREKWKEEVEKWKEEREYLWHGGRLARALELQSSGVLRLSELEASFIEASESLETQKREEKEAERKEKLENARQLAEAERKRAQLARQRADEQARFARKTLYGLAVVLVLFLAAVGAAWATYRARIKAQDQALIAVASDWLRVDPTKAALVLLELREPDQAPRAAPLMHEALALRLAALELADHESENRAAVRAAAFDPLGKRIVTASRDGTARLWEVDGSPVLSDGEPVVLPHEDDLWNAVFDPRGERVLTASNGGTAHLWKVDGGPVLNAAGEPVVLRHGGEMYTAVFSPGGDRIATASDVGTVRLWHASGQPVETEADAEGRRQPLVLAIEGGRQANSALFDCQGERLLVADNSGAVSIYQADGGRRLWRKNLHGKNAIWSAVFDPTGSRILTASVDGTARLWHADDGSPVLGADGASQVVLVHEDDVHTAVFTPAGEECSSAGDEERILTASNDGTARLWLRRDGAPISTPDGRPIVLRHEGGLKSARFSPDGSRILTASKDGTARLWDTESGGEALVVGVSAKPGRTNSARFGPTPRNDVPLSPPADSRIVTGSARAVVRMFLAETGEPVLQQPGSSPPDTDEIRPSSIWTAEQLDWPLELEGHHPWRSVLETAISPDGDWLATASEDGTARIWRADGKPVEAEGGDPAVLCHDDRFRCAAFHNLAGKALVCLEDTSETGDSGRPGVRCLNDPSRNVALVASAGRLCLPQLRSVAISPTGDRMVTTSVDGTARVWTATGAPVPPAGGGGQIVMCHDDTVSAASFSPAGDRIVTASQDKTARVWNADGSPFGDRDEGIDEPRRFFRELDHRVRGKVASAAFSPDGSRIVTAAGLDAWVWRVDGTGEPVQLKGHEKEVKTAVFDSTGTLVVTGSEDGTARVWDATGQGDPQVLRGHAAKVTSAEFDHRSQRVVTTTAAKSAPGSARVWKITYEGLGAEIRRTTAVCLDQRFRRRTLGESKSTAGKRSARCGECLKEFRQRQGPLDRAFNDFRECTLPALF